MTNEISFLDINIGFNWFHNNFCCCSVFARIVFNHLNHYTYYGFYCSWWIIFRFAIQAKWSLIAKSRPRILQKRITVDYWQSAINFNVLQFLAEKSSSSLKTIFLKRPKSFKKKELINERMRAVQALRRSHGSVHLYSAQKKAIWKKCWMKDMNFIKFVFMA